MGPHRVPEHCISIWKTFTDIPFGIFRFCNFFLKCALCQRGQPTEQDFFRFLFLFLFFSKLHACDSDMFIKKIQFYWRRFRSHGLVVARKPFVLRSTTKKRSSFAAFRAPSTLCYVERRKRSRPRFCSIRLLEHKMMEGLKKTEIKRQTIVDKNTFRVVLNNFFYFVSQLSSTFFSLLSLWIFLFLQKRNKKTFSFENFLSSPFFFSFT